MHTFPIALSSRVALLAEGVDRNILDRFDRRDYQVALLAEGVDRNEYGIKFTDNTPQSPSSRRAWIEIAVRVAVLLQGASPSSRRVWIEITCERRTEQPF